MSARRLCLTIGTALLLGLTGSVTAQEDHSADLSKVERKNRARYRRKSSRSRCRAQPKRLSRTV
jgi:hypothetical protein